MKEIQVLSWKDDGPEYRCPCSAIYVWPKGFIVHFCIFCKRMNKIEEVHRALFKVVAYSSEKRASSVLS